MKLRLGSNQKSIMRDLLWTYLDKNKKAARTNRIIRREYQIAKGLYDKLTGRRRVCSKCGQEIKK